MNRTEFIAELTAAIRDLSKDDVARVLEYYGEMIDERVEDGMSESEAVAALGSVDAIAAQIMKDIPRERNTLPEHYGQRAAAGSERAANETYTVEEPFNSLDVRLIAADVRILNARDGETRIETSGDESVGETVEVRDGVLTVVQEAPRRQNVKFGGILTGILDGIFCGGGRVTVFLSDRQWDSVRISTKSGDVEAQDFRARTVKISTKSGDVDARHLDVAERVETESLSGDVRLETMQAGEIAVRSISGDLELDGLCARSVSAGTTSGDVEIGDTVVDGMLNAETTSGDVELERSDARELRLVSTSGDVDGTLLSPKEFFAHSTTGDVSVPESRNGAGRCDVRTVSGDVSIRIAP